MTKPARGHDPADPAVTVENARCSYPHDDPAPAVHPNAEFALQRHDGTWAGVCGDDLYAWLDASDSGRAYVVFKIPQEAA